MPPARVVHLGGRSTGQVPLAMQRELWRSRLYLYRKHRSPLETVALASLLLTAQILSLVATSIKRLFGRITPTEVTRRRRIARALIKVALSR